MNFENTINYIYKNCVDRVEKRVTELNIPHYFVCPEDKSLVSHFFKCDPTPNNPYLVTDKLFYNKDKSNKQCGFIPTLHFSNYFEVLWGNDLEFNRNIPLMFINILHDMLADKSEYDVDIELVLCDYVPYAKYSTLSYIKKKTNISLLKYYGVYDEMVSPINMCIYQERALNYLYSKEDFRHSFEESFYKFACDTLTFTKINQKMIDKYIAPVFIPLLKKNLPSSDSLGLRVKNLIENDLSKTKALIESSSDIQSNTESDLARMLINASSTYIAKLEEIQEKYITKNVLS